MKIEITAGNSSVYRHIGKALVAIAEEMEGVSLSPQVAADLPTQQEPEVVAPTPEQKEPEVVAPPPPPPVNAGLPVQTPGALDTDGIPWDNRIHASSHTQCKDGTWKLRPGVDKDLVTQVKAELKGAQALPVPPPPPVEVVAQTPGCPANFAEMIKALTPHLTSGKLSADQVNAACQTVGLATFNLLAARQDLIPAVWSQLVLAL